VERRRVLALATVSSLVLSMSLAVAPVSAGPPTEISVSPQFRDLFYCPGHATDRAYWTVDLSGGTSGSYSVTVYYGDGSPGNWSAHTVPTYDTHHDFTCGRGWENQSWSASRGGGGTGRYYTTVYTW